jgi:hypothetical protein
VVIFSTFWREVEQGSPESIFRRPKTKRRTTTREKGVLRIYCSMGNDAKRCIVMVGELAREEDAILQNFRIKDLSMINMTR